MLEVSRDAVAAGEEQLVSFAAEQSKYCSICTVTLGPTAIYLSRVRGVGSLFVVALTVWAVVMPPAVAALNIGVGPCWGKTFGDMLEAMERIAPSQPNEAMESIASRRHGKISFDPSCRVQIPEKGY